MARQMTVIAFDEDEKVKLREVNDSKAFNAAVKPLVDQLRAQAAVFKTVGSAKTVDEDQLQETMEAAKGMADLLDTLPDSEAKEAHLLVLQEARAVLRDALGTPN